MTTEDDKKTRIDAMVDKIVNHDLPFFHETINDKDKMRGIKAEIKADRARKDACQLHRFEGGFMGGIGRKYKCLSCGGEFSLTDIGTYLRGYVAAGKPATDIWPGWGE